MKMIREALMIYKLMILGYVRAKKFLVIFVIFLIPFLVACSTEQFQHESSTTQTFQVNNNPKIELQSIPGDLQLITGSDKEIEVSAQPVGIGPSEEIAKANHDALLVNFSQQDDTIFIVGDQSLGVIREGTNLINYTITVPISTTLNIQMSPSPSVPDNQSIELNAAIGLSTFLLVLVLIISFILGRKLKLANDQIQKISTENRALRGTIHMKNIELENLEQKVANLQKQISELQK